MRRVIGERREKARFAIARALEFVITDENGFQERGAGRTVNLSSNGVLFEAPLRRRFRPGVHVQLRISWPARFQNLSDLRLWIFGKATRCDERQVALQISHYDFRTAGDIRRMGAAETPHG